jgi:opacity protein-like surface antigen
MKNSTAFAVAGLIWLFTWGAAFAQSSQIPVGSGAGVSRQPAGSRFRTPPNPPPAVVAPVPVAVPTAFSWTGFYFGGDFGGSFASTSIASATTGWASRSLNPADVMGGVYGGYNYQVSPNFVIGLEGDFQGNHSSANFYYPTFDVAPSVQQNWVASLNGRLGIAYDRALFCAIGGAAWGQGSVTVTPGFVLFPANLPPVSLTANLSGWDVGAGIEYAFDPRWVAGLNIASTISAPLTRAMSASTCRSMCRPQSIPSESASPICSARRLLPSSRSTKASEAQFASFAADVRFQDKLAPRSPSSGARAPNTV